MIRHARLQLKRDARVFETIVLGKDCLLRNQLHEIAVVEEQVAVVLCILASSVAFLFAELVQLEHLRLLGHGVGEHHLLNFGVVRFLLAVLHEVALNVLGVRVLQEGRLVGGQELWIRRDEPVLLVLLALDLEHVARNEANPGLQELEFELFVQYLIEFDDLLRVVACFESVTLAPKYHRIRLEVAALIIRHVHPVNIK